MKVIAAFLLAAVIGSSSLWSNNLEQAKVKAKEEGRLILLNFSGSDWCGPCIKLRKDVLDSDEFIRYANNRLILVNADFPRLKKNQLDKEQLKVNEELAEKYNPKGIFPYTLLLDANGNILKAWEGNPGLTPEKFIDAIRLK